MIVVSEMMFLKKKLSENVGGILVLLWLFGFDRSCF